MIIAVDFDGTCVTHEFPKVGKNIGAACVLKALAEAGHKIILYTMRSHPLEEQNHSLEYEGPLPSDILQDAVDWFKHNQIPLWGINENPDQKTWTQSPKPYAHLYLDDASVGAPLVFQEGISERAFISWPHVVQYLVDRRWLDVKVAEKCILEIRQCWKKLGINV